MAIAAWQVIHTDGTTTDYQAAANTDISRGNALIAACAACAASESVSDVSAAHTHDVGTQQITLVAGSSAAYPTKFIGAGINTTTIYSQRNGTGACIKPNSHQEWRAFTIIGNSSSSTSQTLFGHRTGDSTAYTDVLRSDVRCVGQIDSLHTTNVVLTCSVRSVRCEDHSSFDAVAFVNGTGAGSSFEFIGCTLRVELPNTLYPASATVSTATLRCITTSVAAVRMDGCTLTNLGNGNSGDPSAFVNDGIRITTGSVKMYGGSITTAGDNPLDIDIQGAGTVELGNDVTYDSGKVNGSPSVVAAWTPATPTDLAAVPNAAAGKIDLTWTNNQPALVGGAVVNFVIEYGTDPALTGASTTTAASGATTKQITGLSGAVRYYFRMHATNATGDSANSNIANAVAPGQYPFTATPTSGRVGLRTQRIRRTARAR